MMTNITNVTKNEKDSSNVTNITKSIWRKNGLKRENKGYMQ